MIEETGRVVAVEKNTLWVETIRKAACDSCASQKGCGHSVLAKLGDGKNHVRVLNPSPDNYPFAVGDDVVIGVPEDVVVVGSMIAYLLPLICLLVFSVAGQLLWGSDGYTILFGMLGLILGFVFVRWHFLARRDDARFQPSIIRPANDTSFGVCKIYPAESR